MAEQTFLATPFQGARGLVIAPFQFETTEDDNLRIESANSLAGVVITLAGRRRTAAGTIETFSRTHTPNTDRTVKTEDFKLGAGALLNLTIFASTGSPLVGQTFVSARFIRGLGAATIVLGTLLSGYVTASQHQAYPGSSIQDSITGGGYFRAIAGTTPAAGGEILETVPTGARWTLQTLRYKLATSGVGGARSSRLSFTTTNAAVEYARMLPASAQAISDTEIYAWAPNLPGITLAASGIQQSIAQLTPLLADYHFGTSTAGGQGGDQYSEIEYCVQEWLEVA